MSSAPFVNVKLVLLMVGVLCVWHARPKMRTLALPAAVWIGAAAFAGVVGVDRWWSLVGPESTGNGLLLLGACAFLLVAGAATPDRMRARIPVWLVGTATAVAAVALVDRLGLDAVERFVGGLSLDGGTLGHPVFLAALMGAGVAAAVGLDRLPTTALAPILVVMTSALALSTKRVGWVSLAVGLAVALWRVRPPRRRSLVIVGVVAATLFTWTAVDAFARSGATPLSGAGRFSELASGSAQARVQALAGLGRAWTRRPVAGWGPGNTWSAHLSSARASELQLGERGVGDAHNLLMESAVTTGIVGLAALLVLGGLTIRRMRGGPRSLGWAAGAAAALGAAHLLQPVNVSLTPLLFLLAGLAGRSPPADDVLGDIENPSIRRRPRALARVARVGFAALLAGFLSLSLVCLAASALERHGRTYASESSLRAALKIAPARVSAAEALALHLAFDGRGGDVRAFREAVALAERTVQMHPWNPGVRFAAADVHLMLRDPATAAVWIARQRARFPGDPILPGGAQDPSGAGSGRSG